MVLITENGTFSPEVVREVIEINKGIRRNVDHYDHTFQHVGIKDEVVVRREIRNSGYDFTTLRDDTIRIMWRN